MLTKEDIDIFKNTMVYANEFRLESYRNQINEVLSKGFESILIIGVGDGVVPLLIKHNISQMNLHTKVTTFDIERDLNPDIVGDIRDIKELTMGLKFDCILCCQVLEHLEFKYFEQILYDFSMIAKTVIISLPHSRRSIFHLTLKVPKIKKIDIEIMIPKKFHGIKVHKHHHWELGCWGECYPVKKIETIFKKNYVITNRYHVPKVKYHLFYVLVSKHKKTT